MKTIIFKALAIGLLLQALVSGPAVAAGPTLCPAFNSAMVDAAAMASQLRFPEPPVNLSFGPGSLSIRCTFNTAFGGFNVSVGNFGNEAVVSGSNSNQPIRDTTLLSSVVEDVSRVELSACVAQVLQSWVWNHLCEPFLPPVISPPPQVIS